MALPGFVPIFALAGRVNTLAGVLFIQNPPPPIKALSNGHNNKGSLQKKLGAKKLECPQIWSSTWGHLMRVARGIFMNHDWSIFVCVKCLILLP